MARRKTGIFIVKFLLLLCLLVLTKFILFKKSPSYYKNYFRNESLQQRTIRENKAYNNYTLFATIRNFYNNKRMRGDYKMGNIGGNIIGFIPLGFLFPFIFRRKFRGILTLLSVFLVSLFFELVQLKTGIGVFDVDDLFLNTTGGLAGLLLYYLVRFLFRRSQDTEPIHR